jgi:hypothetical protein
MMDRIEEDHIGQTVCELGEIEGAVIFAEADIEYDIGVR